MLNKNPILIVSVIASVAILAGCTTASAHVDRPPAAVKAVPGTDVKQVRLTERAIQRLGIATQAVRKETASLDGRRGPHAVIPYSAVVYANDGSTWTFVNVAPRTFMRQRITVGAIEGDTAVLVHGPALGVAVVTVGAPELLGTEYNISGEE